MGPQRTQAGLVARARRARTVVEHRARDRGRRVLAAAPRPVRTGWGLAERTARDVHDDRVLGLAAEVALFTLISLPALLLMMLGSLGFVADMLGSAGTAELDRIVFDLPRTLLSGSTYQTYEPLARQVVAEGRADVIGFGLLLSLWTGSRATNRFLETLSIAYDIEGRRPGWRRRLLAYALTLLGLLSAVAVLPLLVLGPRLVDLTAPDRVADPLLAAGGTLYWPMLGLLVLAGLTTLFHVGVPWRTPWRRDLPGAVLAMVLWFAAAAALRAYLALGGTSGGGAAYQQLGTPIAVVLWLYVSAIAVLLGAELNAEIEKTWPTIDEPRRRRRRDFVTEQMIECRHGVCG